MVCKYLGAKKTCCWTLRRGVLPFSCLIKDSRCSTVLGVCCHILHSIIHQVFSVGGRCVLQAPGVFCYKAMLFQQLQHMV